MNIFNAKVLIELLHLFIHIVASSLVYLNLKQKKIHLYMCDVELSNNSSAIG